MVLTEIADVTKPLNPHINNTMLMTDAQEGMVYFNILRRYDR